MESELGCSQSLAKSAQTQFFLTCGKSVIGIWETSGRFRKKGMAMDPFGRERYIEVRHNDEDGESGWGRVDGMDFEGKMKEQVNVQEQI